MTKISSHFKVCERLNWIQAHQSSLKKRLTSTELAKWQFEKFVSKVYLHENSCETDASEFQDYHNNIGNGDQSFVFLFFFAN